MYFQRVILSVNPFGLVTVVALKNNFEVAQGFTCTSSLINCYITSGFPVKVYTQGTSRT